MPQFFGAGGSGGGGGGGSYALVSTVAISAVANIDFTGLLPGFDYIFSIRDATPAASTTFCQRLSQSGTFDTANHYVNNASSSLVSLFANINNISPGNPGGGLSGDYTFLNVGETSQQKSMMAYTSYQINSNNYAADLLSGRFQPGNTNAVDGVRFFFNGQNFLATGTISVYTRAL